MTLHLAPLSVGDVSEAAICQIGHQTRAKDLRRCERRICSDANERICVNRKFVGEQLNVLILEVSPWQMSHRPLSPPPLHPHRLPLTLPHPAFDIPNLVSLSLLSVTLSPCHPAQSPLASLYRRSTGGVSVIAPAGPTVGCRLAAGRRRGNSAP